MAVTAGARVVEQNSPGSFRHTNSPSQQGLGRRRPEAHDDLRTHDRDLGLEPRPAGGDLHGVRLLVDPLLPRGSHLKCLTTFVT